MRRSAPPAVRQRSREVRKVPRLDLLNLKAALPNQRRNVPCHGQALEHPAMKWLQSLLPALYGRIGGEPELKENQPTAWSQDAAKTSRASSMPEIVHNVNVLTTVSTVSSSNGRRSPGTSRNSILSLVRRRALWAR